LFYNSYRFLRITGVYAYCLMRIVGIGQSQTVSFDLKQESKQPISLVTLFELVAVDLQTLNDNLLSVSVSYKLFLALSLSILCLKFH